jgi:Cu(I)/Ag(I) efflux system membrane fusion protein
MNAMQSGSGRGHAARLVVFSALAGALLASGVWLAWQRLGGAGGEKRGMRAVGALRLAVETRPGAPKVGENTLRVRVTDAAGTPLRGARVEALVFMPQMGAMPRMESKPPMRETARGVYEGRFHLAMGGSWDVDLAVTPAQGAPTRVALRLTVETEGLTWVSDEGGPEGATVDAAAADTAAGTVTLSAQRRQEIGVTVDTLHVRDLDYERRVAGRVAYDETRRSEVTLKFSGWVRELRADFVGQAVRRGDLLLTVYSPDLYSAQRELVEALAVRDSLPAGLSRDRIADLAAAARRRLLLWDLAPAQVAELERSRRPLEAVPIRAPVSGVILEKTVVQGSAVMPGQTLFRLAPVDPIWVLADVFQNELPLLETGAPAQVNLPGSSGPARPGRIAFIYPYLEEATRTGQVRIEVPNRDLALKPEMFVDVTLRVPLGRRLAVPVGAVVYGGERRFVFVDRGQGRLEPREVQLGPRAGDYFAVTAGLAAGDVVVTSGNFLVAAESRLRSALGNW